MKYRELGRTGFNVSEISLGTVEIGMPYGIVANSHASVPDEPAAARLLNQALDLGINFIDTARAYGESEAIIGRSIAHRRREFVLASKVLTHHAQNLTPAELRDRTVASVHESLRLLHTDAIDLLMMHSAPVEAILNGDLLEVLKGMQQQGHIRKIGASVYGEEAAVAAIDDGGYDCLQIAYSVLDRRPESRLFAKAAENNVGLVARSVLLKGALTDRDRYLPDALAELKITVRQMRNVAAREQMTLPELAYRYVLSQRLPQTALVGTASVEELEQAIDFARRGPLSGLQIEAIRSLAMPDAYHLNPANWPPG
jgi:aryl-alcohol dehydrogenase-like predicted oxidoreductase